MQGFLRGMFGGEPKAAPGANQVGPPPEAVQPAKIVQNRAQDSPAAGGSSSQPSKPPPFGGSQPPQPATTSQTRIPEGSATVASMPAGVGVAPVPRVPQAPVQQTAVEGPAGAPKAGFLGGLFGSKPKLGTDQPGLPANPRAQACSSVSKLSLTLLLAHNAQFSDRLGPAS